MIYVFSGLVLLAPLLFTLLLIAELPTPAKIWIGLSGVALLVIIPIVVLLLYGGSNPPI